MVGEVVSFPPPLPPAQEGPSEVVMELERLLEQAREGKVKAFIVVLQDEIGTDASIVTDEGNLCMLLGRLRVEEFTLAEYLSHSIGSVRA